MEIENTKQLGWISLHRKILNNPVVTKDPEHFTVWVYFLLSATHKEQNALFRGKRIKLQPGQLLTGRLSVSRKLKIEETKIRRIIKSFKSDHQITQQTSNKNSLITILNWEEYQKNAHQNEQQVPNKCPTSAQQVPTNNNVNNENNEKKGNKEKFSPSNFEVDELIEEGRKILKIPFFDGDEKENWKFAKKCLERWGDKEYIYKVLRASQEDDFWIMQITNFKNVFNSALKVVKSSQSKGGDK